MTVGGGVTRVTPMPTITVDVTREELIAWNHYKTSQARSTQKIVYDWLMERAAPWMGVPAPSAPETATATVKAKVKLVAQEQYATEEEFLDAIAPKEPEYSYRPHLVPEVPKPAVASVEETVEDEDDPLKNWSELDGIS